MNLKIGDMKQNNQMRTKCDPFIPGQSITLVGGRSKKRKEIHAFFSHKTFKYALLSNKSCEFS